MPSPTTPSQFWNTAVVEPKRKFRWILQVNGIDYWTVKKVDKPSYTVSEAEHSFINHKFYFPGRVEYNEIGFTIVDSANPDAAETLRQILFAGGYRLPKDQNIATQSITKLGAVNALGKITILQIGGGGNPQSGAGAGTTASLNDEGKLLEYWSLHNAWIKSIELGDLDYTAEDLNEINVKVRYDYAQLNDPAAPPGGWDISDIAAHQGIGYAVGAGLDPNRQD